MNAENLAKKIKLIIFDVDGVLTDVGLYFSEDDSEMKRFNSLDGHGIKMLKENGVEPAVISARNSKSVDHRMNNLGIEHFYQGQSDKVIAFNDLLEKLNVSADEVAYMGDDVIDLPVMAKVGFAVAVANAHDLVKEHADLITEKTGGHGAAREVCDFILTAQGNFDKEMKAFTLTDFQNLCYQTLKAKVPAGKVITYGGLAKLINHPKACRAVGSAMNKNPSPKVPCHRVVKAKGELGGFAISSSIKIQRLKAEGVFVENGRVVDFQNICV